MPRLPLIKRFVFRDEREYRVVGLVPEVRSLLSIPLTPDLVQRVTFSPFTHPNIVASLKIALRALPAWQNLRVDRSHLTANETWQEALGSLVDRHGCIYGPWEPIDADAFTGITSGGSES